MRRFLGPTLIVISIILAAGAAGFWAGRTGLADLRRENAKLKAVNRQLRENSEEVALFFVKATPTDFYLKPTLTGIKREPDRYRAVLEALLQGPPRGSGLYSIFSKKVKVLRVEVNHGLAVVDLSREATQINVGAEGEILAVASIVNTLTKLPPVFAVKILIEGEEVESLAGHVDLTQTFGYNDKVVRYQ